MLRLVVVGIVEETLDELGLGVGGDQASAVELPQLMRLHDEDVAVRIVEVSEVGHLGHRIDHAVVAESVSPRDALDRLAQHLVRGVGIGSQPRRPTAFGGGHAEQAARHLLRQISQVLLLASPGPLW